jgi:tRNA (guanine37-N1)-methyltransferase
MAENMLKEVTISATAANQDWSATVVTLFPEMFPGSLGLSLAGKALDDGLWSIDTVDIRDFAADNQQTVDDTPFGGGAGMVMRADVIDAALMSVRKSNQLSRIYVTPRGTPLTQTRVKELAASAGVVILCGRYEGIDNRVLDAWDIEEISLGDFVLSGGEPAALAIIDACVRLLPGVIGNKLAPIEESFEGGLLEYPHYTRPREWDGREVPEILLSGHHENVRIWRQTQAEQITQERRPDLWKKYNIKHEAKFNKH